MPNFMIGKESLKHRNSIKSQIVDFIFDQTKPDLEEMLDPSVLTVAFPNHPSLKSL